MVSLANVAYNARIKPLAHEFKRTDPKGITWLQVVILLLKQHLVEPAAFSCVEVEVSEHD
jgi:hypothetical protein